MLPNSRCFAKFGEFDAVLRNRPRHHLPLMPTLRSEHFASPPVVLSPFEVADATTSCVFSVSRADIVGPAKFEFSFLSKDVFLKDILWTISFWKVLEFFIFVDCLFRWINWPLKVIFVLLLCLSKCIDNFVLHKTEWIKFFSFSVITNVK